MGYARPPAKKTKQVNDASTTTRKQGLTEIHISGEEKALFLAEVLPNNSLLVIASHRNAKQPTTYLGHIEFENGVTAQRVPILENIIRWCGKFGAKSLIPRSHV